MLKIEQTYLIKAAPERVWAALTDPVLQAKWSGQPAQFDPQVGSAYQLFGDYVTGKVIIAEPPNKLAQTWQPVDWTIEDSVVTFTLTPVRGGTQVQMVHENVQPEDFEGTGKGWDEFYLGAIRVMLETEKPKRTAKAVKKPTRARKTVKKRAAKTRTSSTGTKKAAKKGKKK